ncbi:hypothetical protein [Streptomyces sp. NPDC054975]
MQFARWLPGTWRADNRLLRERLVRHGLPAHVVRPVMRETFTDVIARGLHQYAPALLREIADGSPLVKAGYLDRRALLATAEDCERSMQDAAVHSEAYTPIALHLALRSLS